MCLETDANFTGFSARMNYAQDRSEKLTGLTAVLSSVSVLGRANAPDKSWAAIQCHFNELFRRILRGESDRTRFTE